MIFEDADDACGLLFFRLVDNVAGDQRVSGGLWFPSAWRGQDKKQEVPVFHCALYLVLAITFQEFLDLSTVKQEVKSEEPEAKDAKAILVFFFAFVEISCWSKFLSLRNLDFETSEKCRKSESFPEHPKCRKSRRPTEPPPEKTYTSRVSVLRLEVTGTNK